MSRGAAFRIRGELQSAAAGRNRKLNRASAGLFLLLAVVPTSTLAHGGDPLRPPLPVGDQECWNPGTVELEVCVLTGLYDRACLGMSYDPSGLAWIWKRRPVCQRASLSLSVSGNRCLMCSACLTLLARRRLLETFSR